MMTLLLWRCPLCRTNDALQYRARWFRPHLITCARCGAVWQVTRVVGDDYRLQVIGGKDAPVGLDLPLAEWYDRVKSGEILVPLDSKAVDVKLAPGEIPYLRGDRVPFIVRIGNPLLSSSYHEREAPEGPFDEELTPKWERLGPGTLYLTSERVIWEGPERGVDFWWPKITSVFTWATVLFGVMYGATTYRFEAPPQSVLKWVTYGGHQARRVEEKTGRKIYVTCY